MLERILDRLLIECNSKRVKVCSADQTVKVGKVLINAATYRITYDNKITLDIKQLENQEAVNVFLDKIGLSFWKCNPSRIKYLRSQC